MHLLHSLWVRSFRTSGTTVLYRKINQFGQERPIDAAITGDQPQYMGAVRPSVIKRRGQFLWHGIKSFYIEKKVWNENHIRQD